VLRPVIAAASKCSGAHPDQFCALALAWGCRSTTTAVFDLIRPQRHGADAVLCAFGLIELDVEDLRRTVIEQRKGRLVRLIRDRHPGIVFNAHYIVDGGCLQKRLRARL
jgi:hypothetical protein